MIELTNIFKIYHEGSLENEVRAVDGISLTINEGEYVAIVGASGSGKSSLMNIIGALDIPTYGTYHLNGQDVSTLKDDQLATIRNQFLGFIFQQYNLINKLSVYENVELPLIYTKLSDKERNDRVLEALSKVGLENRTKHVPSKLSGGQQQRVSIARALATNPKVILADEPTGALDSKTGEDVMNFIKQLNDEGNTIVLITHDNNLASQAKRVIKISDGKIVCDTTGDNYDVH